MIIGVLDNIIASAIVKASVKDPPPESIYNLIGSRFEIGVPLSLSYWFQNLIWPSITAPVPSEILNKYPVSCYNYKVWSSETIQNWSKMQEHLKSTNNLNCSTRKKAVIMKKIEQGKL